MNPSATTGPGPQPVPDTPAAPRPPWQTCLDIENAAGTVYESHFNPQFLTMFARPPRTLLDIGCSTGNLATEMKARHPACRTIGVEPNRATAEVARTRLDQVIAGRFEDIDFAAEGIAPGSIDTVVAADVLEHLYDPWRAMLRLKPLLTPDAHVLLSIPNSRHLSVLKQLGDEGRWPYEEKGLLDITHIRFFTLREIERFLAETGYHPELVNFFLDPALSRFYSENCQQPEINVRLGRLSLERIPQKEFAELCTWQFFIRARPA